MTRTTVEYEKNKNGWRYIKTTEVEVKTQHQCLRERPPFREPKAAEKVFNTTYPRRAL